MPEEWERCVDPQKMLEAVRSSGRASDRQLRLFAVACCRQVWQLIPTNDTDKRAALVSERFADRLATEAELRAARQRVRGSCELASTNLDAYRAAEETARIAAWKVRSFVWHTPRPPGQERVPGDVLGAARRAQEDQARAQAGLLREILGNPFRPPPASEPAPLAWREGMVRRLAESIYDSGGFEALPSLADALERTGNSDHRLLDHLRGPGPHVLGCHALDSILGKEQAGRAGRGT
jgi:hypothetical protein